MQREEDFFWYVRGMEGAKRKRQERFCESHISEKFKKMFFFTAS
jgi:hypothetical protein